MGAAPAVVRRGEAILRRLPAGPCSMVEVGVNKADLGAFLAEKRHDLRWTGVDSWLPSDLQPEAYRATRDMHAHLTKENQDARKERSRVAMAPFGPRCKLLNMISNAAALLFAESSLDLVFLDGDHSQEGVEKDIEAWWPKVKPLGWIGGHDYGNTDPRYHLNGVRRAVDAWAARERAALELDKGKTWWARRAGD